MDKTDIIIEELQRNKLHETMVQIQIKRIRFAIWVLLILQVILTLIVSGIL